MAIVYRGFTTVNKRTAPFTATDIDLVKIDLMNTFNTKRGERVMMPNFGSIIHELIMDPLDGITVDLIKADVEAIINGDPRVALLGGPIITDLDHTVRVEIELNFIAQATADHLYIEFERDLRDIN